MGKKKEYSDTYAKVVRFSARNIVICYWNNNVSINDFARLEGGLLQYEHEGEYLGLHAKIKLTLDGQKVRSLFRKNKERGPIRFRGNLDHMGIRIHVRRNAFPAKHSGEMDGLRYTIEMDGTDALLSYADERERTCGQFGHKRQVVHDHGQAV